jgi:hypothetical protein
MPKHIVLRETQRSAIPWAASRTPVFIAVLSTFRTADEPGEEKRRLGFKVSGDLRLISLEDNRKTRKPYNAPVHCVNNSRALPFALTGM